MLSEKVKIALKLLQTVASNDVKQSLDCEHLLSSDGCNILSNLEKGGLIKLRSKYAIKDELSSYILVHSLDDISLQKVTQATDDFPHIVEVYSSSSNSLSTDNEDRMKILNRSVRCVISEFIL